MASLRVTGLATLRHHAVALLVLSAGAWMGLAGLPDLAPKESLGVRAFGYGALLLLGVTLAIGPLARLQPRLFSRLLPYRRATGIWSAVSALHHLLYMPTLVGNYRLTLWSIFGTRTTYPGGTSQFSVAIWDRMVGHLPLMAWTGGIALAILLVIALVSNDGMQRWLGQSTWKLVQQQAYTAFVFVALHILTMKYVAKLKTTPPLLWWAPWLLLIVAGLQFAGFVYTVWKKRSDRA